MKRGKPCLNKSQTLDPVCLFFSVSEQRLLNTLLAKTRWSLWPLGGLLLEYRSASWGRGGGCSLSPFWLKQAPSLNRSRRCWKAAFLLPQRLALPVQPGLPRGRSEVLSPPPCPVPRCCCRCSVQRGELGGAGRARAAPSTAPWGGGRGRRLARRRGGRGRRRWAGPAAQAWRTVTGVAVAAAGKRRRSAGMAARPGGFTYGSTDSGCNALTSVEREAALSSSALGRSGVTEPRWGPGRGSAAEPGGGGRGCGIKRGGGGGSSPYP